MISLYLIRPFTIELEYIHKLQTLLRGNRLSLPRTTRPKCDVLADFDKHLEEKYFKRLGSLYEKKNFQELPSCQPYRLLIKGTAGRHRFHIRENGLCSLISNYSMDATDPKEVRKITRIYENDQKKLDVTDILESFANQLGVEFPKLEKAVEFMHIEGITLDVPELMERYGVSEKVVVNESVTSTKIFSKPLHIISIPGPMKKHSRSRMRWKIIHAIELGYGINYFIQRSGKDFKSMDLTKWRILFHCWNPLIISGRGELDPLIPSLTQLWFNRISKILDLRRRYRELIIAYLSEAKTSAYQMLNIHQALKELRINRNPMILPSLTESDPTLNETQLKIYKIIRRRFYDVRKETTFQDYPRGAGMTFSEIMAELGTRMGRKNENIKAVLDSLVAKRLIIEESYKGPGRGKNKKIYSLKLNEYEYKSELVEYVKQKLPEDQDEIPVNYGWPSH